MYVCMHGWERVVAAEKEDGRETEAQSAHPDSQSMRKQVASAVAAARSSAVFTRAQSLTSSIVARVQQRNQPNQRQSSLNRNPA
jgi:predicted secreted Zn-dependent protease